MNGPHTAYSGFEPSGGSRKAVGLWLLASAFMVFAMMVIGAITRLTESGLSMVEWRPLIGVLPPLSDGEWDRVFTLYKETSQYRLLNEGMSLDEFRTIFFWEWFHRFWGRMIGLVYGLPFLWFLIRGRLPEGYKAHAWILLGLGAVQAVIGMWMVQSGFVDRTEVSHYRLAIHLGMAFLILGYLVWLALGLLAPVGAGRPIVPRGLRRWGGMTHGIVFVTVLSGALVAGLDAGKIYTDWPLMGGDFIPYGYWDSAIGAMSLFEVPEAVQFNHRMLAYTTALAVLLYWLKTRSLTRQGRVAQRVGTAANWLLLGLVVQVTLGIATLVTVVDVIALAAAHQAGAAMLFCLALWNVKELRG